MKTKSRLLSVMTIFVITLALLVLMLSLFGADTTSARAIEAPISKVAADGIHQSTTVSKQQSDSAIYIIVLQDAPLVAYKGGIPGLAATNPRARGERKVDVNAPDSVAYLDYLAQKRGEAVASMSAALGRTVTAVYEYKAALNGLAVELTAAEAAIAASLPEVKSIEREMQFELHTDAGPSWIGAPSIWDGSATGGLPATMGEGIIVGVIDTGIDPWNPSFADIGGDGYDHINPWGAGAYVGVCDSTDPSYDPTFPCNDKLIGAWGFASVNGGDPRDSDGHGSHTSSTAAGNFVYDTVISTTTAVFSASISGVAPHANVVMYAACCAGAALSAARDQAVMDGVDVVNYSIGANVPTGNPWADAESQQWLNMRDAGIFVATSAGNNGPDAATLFRPGDIPWLTAVAASSHDRTFLNSLTVYGDSSGPITLDGESMTGPLDTPAEVVLSRWYTAGGTIDPEDARLCADGVFSGTVDFNGAIVVCERGIYGRVAKGQTVLDAGAGGYILAQPDEFGGGPGSLASDPHVLPAVHIDYYAYQDLLNYMVSAPSIVTGTIAGSVRDINEAHGDILASFSSRGPNSAPLLPDILKPQVSAPGRAIWAAYHQGDGGDGTYTYNVIQGTSMASPHVAGAGALLMALHPEWTPSMIESALATTADTGVVNDDGLNPATPFGIGSGRVELRKAAEAGLVLDVTTAEFQAANPNLGGDPKALNLPSMANSDCLSTCSWTRTVSSTLSVPMTWTASVQAPAGMLLTVNPSSFVLPAYGSQEIEITADVSGLTQGQWTFAEVSLIPEGSPLIAGTGDFLGSTAHSTYEIDVGTSAASPIFSNTPFWGAAYDEANERVLFTTSGGSTDGADLLEWPVAGGVPITIGTIVSGATEIRIDGLAMSNGTLYGAHQFNDAVGPAGIYEIDLNSFQATFVMGLADGAVSGIDADPGTGTLYGVDDAMGQLVEIDLGSSTTIPVAAYPSGETDIDGLAIGNGRAYMIPDDNVPLEIYVYDLNSGTYEASLISPWTGSDTFSGGAFITGGLPEAHFPVAVIRGGEPPTIDIPPDAKNTQTMDVMVVQPFTITNNGEVDLTWDIFEDASTKASASVAGGGWSDNFDSYATGVNLHGMGGWSGWGNDPVAGAFTSNAQARSVPNSVDINGSADLIHPYTQTSGIWTYTAWQYIPSSFSGTSYFIMLNQYDDACTTCNWSVQVNFNSITGLMTDDGGGGSMPYVTDAWAKIEVIIDLDSDTQVFRYNDTPLYTAVWNGYITGGGSGSNAIAVVDLYANGAATVYYDDLSLVSGAPMVESCQLPSNIAWLSASPTSGTTMSGNSSVVDLTFDSTGLTAGMYTGILCVSSNDPVNPLVSAPVTLTVTAQGPPDIVVDPASLSANHAPDNVSMQTLDISNVGDADLIWTIDEAAPVLAIGSPSLIVPENVDLAALVSSGEPGAALPVTTRGGSAVLWEQVNNGTSGIVSDYSTTQMGGAYSASDFVLTGTADITLIFADGFDNQNTLSTEPAIDWAIYPDSGGVPAGNPETNPGAAVWSYSSTPGGTGVDITGNTITLDLVAAGESLSLPAGTYWLTVFPTYDNDITVGGSARWNWFQADQVGAESHLIAPVLFGGLPNWTAFSLLGLSFTDTAFRLEGNYIATPEACDVGNDISWLSVSPTAGTTISDTSSTVDVTFDSTGLTSGTYTGTLCINSNDPDTPLIEMPVTLTVGAPFYGVSIAPDAAMTDTFGATVTYMLEVMNTGNVPDTFDLSVSGNTWTTMLSASSVSLGIGESATLEVTVRIPASVANGSMDTATVAATSQGDGAVTDSATLGTTAVAAGPPVVYLPVFISD